MIKNFNVRNFQLNSIIKTKFFKPGEQYPHCVPLK